MKRVVQVLAIFLILCLSISTVATARAPAMADVSTEDWFHSYVLSGYRNRYIRGTSLTNFRFDPNRALTRGEFIAMLGRFHTLLEGPLNFGNRLPAFYDTQTRTFYTTYLIWAVEAGIIQGDGAGRFHPNAVMTREQMALVLARYIATYELESHFYEASRDRGQYADADRISSAARAAAHQLRNFDIMHGSRGVNDVPGVYYFRPQDNAYRKEAAAVLGRMLLAIFDDDVVTPPPQAQRPSPIL